MNIENEIILGILKSQELLGYSNSINVEPQFFKSDIAKWCFTRIINYYKKFNVNPTSKVLKLKLLRDRNISKEDINLYETYIDNLSKRKLTDVNFIKDELFKFAKNKRLLGALKSTVDILKNTEDPIAAEAELLRNIYLNRSDIKDTIIIDWLNDWEDRQEKRKLGEFFGGKGVIKTGIKPLDLIIDGVYPGEVLTIVGLTGRGKSILALNIGAYNLLNNKNVLHINSENPLWQTLGRYDARIFRLPYKILQQAQLGQQDEKYAKKVISYLRTKIKSKLKIAQVIPNHFNILTIQDIMNKLQTEGFIPDVVILDSPELMNTVGKYKEYRLQKAGAYWEFKGLMIESGISGVATTQAKVSSDKKDGPDSEDLAEAYDKARLIDKIIGIWRTLEDQLKGLLSVNIVKNRDGDAGIILKLATDFSKILVMGEKI